MHRMRSATALCLAIVLFFFSALASAAVGETDWEQKWDRVVSDGSVIAVSPGSDETQMQFCWLDSARSDPAFRYGDNETLTDAVEESVQSTRTIDGKKRCVVVLNSLQPEATYYYAYKRQGVWSETYSFRTAGETQTILFVSDSQIGRSGDWHEKDVLLHDTAGWDATLRDAAAAYPDISLCLSAGDQAEIGFSETQYRLFLAPDMLRSLPTAPTIGNHEFYFPCLNRHFSLPNRFGGSVIHSLGDEPYFFRQGNALFIVLDTNDPLSWDHEMVLEKAVRAFPDAQWRVVMMHHSLFSCEDTPDDGPKLLRRSLVPLLQKYGVNLVLSGHTHRFSRSFPLWDGAVSDAGITYLEGGCCSGCNCKASPENLPAYTAAGFPQTDPVYSVLQITQQEIRISAYAVENGRSVQIDYGVVNPCERSDEGAHSSLIVRILQGVLSVCGRAVSVWFR